MAHNIESRDGQAAMAYVGETPWHRLGQVVSEEEAYDIPLFMERSKLNTTVEKVPLVTADKQQKTNFFAIRRIEDNKILGEVGKNYVVLQNVDSFQWFAPWLKAKQAKLHTAGSLREGSRVWVQAKLNLDPMKIIGADVVIKYILLSHSHDGSLAVRAGFTAQRAVCENTLSMAHSSSASKLLRLKHSKNLHSNLENIRDTMNLINAEFEATAEQYRLLVRKDINQKDLQKYLKLVFKVEDISTRQQNIFGEIINLFENGKGNNVPGVRGTLWAAYNGVTDYLSHVAGRNADNRLNSLLFGANAKMNHHALTVALDMAV